ncbi:MAG TPA: SDR family NAD(P)-dependent oxidoreductase, partial [Candidatus Nanopelagicaceae bacterium]
MTSSLSGKVAFVTGGGSGIGEACSISLAKEGANVVVADRDLVGGQRVVNAIVGFGGKALALDLDVANDDAVEKAIADTVNKFGRLDIAVNNAGIGGDQAPTGDQSVAGWRKVLSINLDGVFYCMRHELGAMKKSGGGSIVNMASI